MFAAATAVVLLSSCNRGMGCPSDFSIGDWMTQLIALLPF